MKSKIDKKLVTKIAKEKILSGKTKQEVYEELVSEYKFRNDIADVVAHIPSVNRWKKYGIWNTLFLVFLILMTLIVLLNPTAALIWMAWLVYITATKKFQYYYWHSLMGVVALIAIFGLSLYQGNIPWAFTIISILLSLLFILAGIYLPKLLTPSYTEVRELYTNTEGENRIIIKHIFAE